MPATAPAGAPPPAPHEYLTVAELALALRVSRATVHRLIATGAIAPRHVHRFGLGVRPIVRVHRQALESSHAQE